MDAQKVALITGASSGIGRATARLLAQHGYFVGMAARQRDRLDLLSRELGDNGLPLQCDVTEEIASAILCALALPEHVAVSEIMVRPVTQVL